jgi:N-methylhydantoinase A
MTRALRVISVERGLDPRDFALVAFGGAGGMHACGLAEELDTRRVLVPRAGGVLSALGLAISDVRRDYLAPMLAPLAEVAEGALAERYEQLEARARADLGDPRLERAADLRYRGQSFELTVRAENLDDGFHAAHERRYGYRMGEEPVELVSLRLTATVPGAKPALRDHGPSGEPGRRPPRRASLDGGWTEIEVLDRTALGSGATVEGPVIVEFPESTCLVRPGWSGSIDEVGTLVLER